MEYKDVECLAENLNGFKCRFYLKKDGENPLIVIGLNPSTADETTPDATMRKVIGFINKWNERSSYNFDSFIMLNLYPLRETSPDVLNQTHEFNAILHERNMEIISDTLNQHPNAKILLCYGDSIESVRWLKYCRDEILKLMVRHEGCSLFSLGNLTNMKNPRHPSRLAYSIDMQPYLNPFTLTEST